MRGNKEENMSLLRAPIYFEAARGRRGEGKGEATRRQVKEVTKEVSPRPRIFAAKHSHTTCIKLKGSRDCAKIRTEIDAVAILDSR